MYKFRTTNTFVPILPRFRLFARQPGTVISNIDSSIKHFERFKITDTSSTKNEVSTLENLINDMLIIMALFYYHFGYYIINPTFQGDRHATLPPNQQSFVANRTKRRNKFLFRIRQEMFFRQLILSAVCTTVALP